MSEPLSDLEERVAALAVAQPFAVHWQIRDLTHSDLAHADPTSAALTVYDTPTIGSGAHIQVASFSTRKVSVLLACLALVHRGQLSLDQRLPITAELAEGVQAGIMRNVAPGVELSLEDHLRQMMITSDNICTQLVFDAIGAAAQDNAAQPTSLPSGDQNSGHQRDDRAAAALQQVNDYCAWIGMRATLHREIFPRSGELSWHHSIEHMTVTTAADQAHLLAQLGRGTQDAEAASTLQLTPQLCRFAVELMRSLYTPLLGAEVSATGAWPLRFAEKNGRGLRSLSQLGLATTDDGAPVAAVAVFAENIPTQLPDGTPGRIAAYELFRQIGQAIQDWHSGEGLDPDRRPAGDVLPAATTGTEAQLVDIAARTGASVATGGISLSGASVDIGTDQEVGGRDFHALAGAGKFLAALTLAEREATDPGLLEMPVTITAEHRRAAAVGPLRVPDREDTQTGDITLSLHDALGLIISTSDAATSLAVRDALAGGGVDLVAETHSFFDTFQAPDQQIFHTRITGLEDPEAAAGDLLTGRTCAHELRQLLMLVVAYGGLAGETPRDRGQYGLDPAAARRVLGWMSQVFEPAGLAYALPGYGPKKLPQWTVSGLETRAAAQTGEQATSSAAGADSAAGWSSVLITRRTAVDSGHDHVVWAAAHVPAEHTGTQAARILGEIGLAAYRADVDG